MRNYRLIFTNTHHEHNGTFTFHLLPSLHTVDTTAIALFLRLSWFYNFFVIFLGFLSLHSSRIRRPKRVPSKIKWGLFEKGPDLVFLRQSLAYLIPLIPLQPLQSHAQQRIELVLGERIAHKHEPPASGSFPERGRTPSETDSWHLPFIQRKNVPTFPTIHLSKKNPKAEEKPFYGDLRSVLYYKFKFRV